MPRNAATAPAAIPCRAPLRLKRGSRHSLLQQPVAGRRWCAKRVTATTRARPILTLLPSKHDDLFNALGSNVDCSGTSHGRCSNSRPAPPPRRMASGSRGTPMPSRYECHRQPALARSSGLVLKLSRRSKHSASDIQAVPQLVGLEQCRARLCQRPGHRQSACEAKGETPAFPVTTQCGLRGGGGRSSHDGFCLVATGVATGMENLAYGELGSHPDRPHHPGRVSREHGQRRAADHRCGRHLHRPRQQLRRRHADGRGPAGAGHGGDPQPGHRRGPDRRLRQQRQLRRQSSSAASPAAPAAR